MFQTIDSKTMLDALQWAILAVISLVVWLRKPGEDAAAAVNVLRTELTARHAALSERQTITEERLRHMPTSEQLAKLEGSIRSLETETEGQSKQLVSMATQLNRIESYLLHNK